MNRYKSKVIITFLLMILSSISLISQETRYELINLQEKMGGFTNKAFALNNLGYVTGQITSLEDRPAFLWTGDNLKIIPSLPHPNGNSFLRSEGYECNDSGFVVGRMYYSGGKEIGFIYDGISTTALPSFFEGGNNYPYDINNLNVITGDASSVTGGSAYIYDGTELFNIGELIGEGRSAGHSINNLEQVVGKARFDNGDFRAFFYDGSMINLGILGVYGTYTKSEAWDINDSSVVVGFSTSTSFDFAPFIWNQETGMRSLPGGRGQARAINNSDIVVGWHVDETVGSGIATKWENGSVTNLNNVVDSIGNWSLTDAIDINDSGQILVEGILIGGGTTRYYFLLNPLPAPEGIVVNTTDDKSDADLEDGICDTDLSEPGEQCSFRAAIEHVNYIEGADVITFNIPGGGIPVISPNSPLPEINSKIVINATTQPGEGLVELKGSNAGNSANGLQITANNCSVQGLIINSFAQDGIKITGSSNKIYGNIIGTNNNSSIGLGNGGNGISIINSSNNIIGENDVNKLNIITSNKENGILISGISASGNRVKSNYIGTDTTGTDGLGNVGNGVLIVNGANNNTIGIDADLTQPEGEMNLSKTSGININVGNVIVNNLNSIKIDNANTNTLLGNLLGLVKNPNSKFNQLRKLNTLLYGIYLKNAFNNLIMKSVIGGTGSDGIRISGPLSKSNTIYKSLIGTGPTGILGLGVGGNGICIDSNAVDNQIGGIGEDSTLTIVSSKKYAVQVRDVTEGIEGIANRIQNTSLGIIKSIRTSGLNKTAGISIAMPNLLGGICVLNSQNTKIGNPLAPNTIAGNKGPGIIIKGISSKLNEIISNYIGTNNQGQEDIGNDGDGICLMDSANNNTIGGLLSLEQNIIASNKMNGIGVFGSFLNKIFVNKIGFIKSGGINIPRGNLYHGLLLQNSYKNLIRLCRIAANKQDGIHITGALSKLNKLSGLTIGTDSSYTPGLGNLGNGISMFNMASGNRIGGFGSDSSITIVSSQKYGLQTGGLLSGASGKIINTFVGIVAGQVMPNNLGGICLENTQNMNIGDVKAPNVIAGNNGPGIILKGFSTATNKIMANFIGTDTLGTENIGNLGPNIKLFNGANNNWFGDEKEENGNIIVSSKSHGIELSNTSDNKFFNNKVGVFKRPWSNFKKMGNLNGLLALNAYKTFIMKSIFSGNLGNGLRITGTGSKQLRIIGNALGTDLTGKNIIGNGRNGLLIDGGANNIDLGNGDGLLKNFINGNKKFGLILKNSVNILLKNFNIGADINGFISPLYKNGSGAIKIEDATNSNIGSIKGKLKNIIAGFDSVGVKIIDSFNSKVENNNITSSFVGVEAIVNQIQETSLKIQRNIISACSRAISIENASQNYIAGNIITDNTGLGSGIHMFNSGGLVEGNILKNDAGDAIYLEDDSNPIVYNNNIYNNTGLGLRNETPSIQINAQSNWWGDASGPSGNGPGSGDGISGNINYQNWMTKPVDLIILGSPDTVYSLTGFSDTLVSSVLNWNNSSDVIDVTISDTKNWYTGENNFSLNLDDILGSAFNIPIFIPAETNLGEVNKITISAKSQLNNTETDQTEIYVSTYTPTLTRMILSPDTAYVTIGDTLQFTVDGYDQVNNSMDFNPEWETDLGSIDNLGKFTTGSTSGIATVTVTDPITLLKTQAIVIIDIQTGFDQEDENLPTEYQLSQNYPNPFNPTTKIRFSLPKTSDVKLEVYNIIGEKVAMLVNSVVNAGVHEIDFNASSLSSGIYIYRIVAGNFIGVKKMILLQ